jgi:hypothetical protein
MSYIIKKNEPLVNLKLTDTGRRNLSNGSLTFAQFGLGDSEVDYLTSDTSVGLVLRPVDNNPDIMYPVPSEGESFRVPITNLNSIPREIKQMAEERGVFNAYTSISRTLDTSLLLDGVFTIASVTGDTITLNKGTTINYPPTEGDTLIIKTGYGSTPVGSTTFSSAQPVLQYKIVDVLTTGTTTSTVVKVDRYLPLFTFTNARAFLYRDELVNTLDKPNPTTYWDDSVLGFDLNGLTTYDDVPVWNFNLVLLGEMMGVDPTVDKNSTQTRGKKLLGTSVLFKYYEEAKLDKIGVIHYTNNSVSNWYGEGFYRSSFKLDLPHVMWHKKQGGGVGQNTTMGYTFVCGADQKILNGKIRYYDLVDQETTPTVVGKVFIDYKICVVEDAELLMTLSIKGNRNWTLPTAKITPTEPGTCDGSSAIGAVQKGESIHISYMMQDLDNYLTPVHCNNYTTFTIDEHSTSGPKDIIFTLPKDPNDPTYSELGYLRDYDSSDTTGFKANRVTILWQKTEAGKKPLSDGWKQQDITNYITTTGCIVGSGDEVVTKTEKYTAGTTLTSTTINLAFAPEQDIIYLYYNGGHQTTGYTVTNGVVTLSSLPSAGTAVKIHYVVDDAANTISDAQKTAANIENIRVFVDHDFLDNSKFNDYYLRTTLNLPALTDSEATFGDEDFLLGNVRTDIKATVFKSVMTCNVLPNQFITSTNPTWNANQDKVQFSEIGIYDQDNDLVAIGKFSQPIQRKYNSDNLVIQATIDF